MASFADDTKILNRIKTEDDILTMQESLDKLYQWEKENNMKFNAGKFKWLQFGRNNDTKDKYLYMGDDCEMC